MSTTDKSLSANAPEFVPVFGSDTRKQTPLRGRHGRAVTQSEATAEIKAECAVNDQDVKPKKKKTKDERSAPRKRRHRRGKSDVPAADMSPTSLKKQEQNVADDSQYESPSRRETSAHHKSKSDGNISMWFDEMKERRLSRFREARDLYGGLDDSDGDASAAHISLVFSQPQEWVFGNSVPSINENVQLLENEDYLAENLERKRWQDWAQAAAEMERRRRIQVLQELDAEQEIERQERRRWAIKAIEKEKAERISAQFLSTLSSTNWFNETITAYHEDYELVCPYYKLGCRVSCRRGNIEKHLKKCRFALELIDEPLPEISGGYEVVCPNAVLGCPYIGCLDALHKHLTECSYSGQTVQQEMEERLLLKEHVIKQQEEERARRVRFDDNILVVKRPRSTDATGPTSADGPEGVKADGEAVHSAAQAQDVGNNSNDDLSDGDYMAFSTSADADSSENSDGGGGRPRSSSRRKALLQSLLEEQTKSVIRSMQKEAESFYLAACEHRAVNFPVQEKTIDILRSIIKGLWSFADVLPFGSHATGLSSTSSDLDLAVCFSDQYISLPTITGVIPLLQNLAECIQRQASDVFIIRKVLLHSTVPIIKADVLKSGLIKCGILPAPQHGGIDNVSDSKKKGGEEVPLVYNISEIQCGKPNISHVDDDVFLSIDISINGPSHSGLATTEFVRSMLHVSPVIGPAVCVLKEFFKSKGLADPYTGGMSSYGIFLLVLLLYQKQNQFMFSAKSATPSPKSLMSSVSSSSSPARNASIRRSFSFGDDEIAASRVKRSVEKNNLSTFHSMEQSRSETYSTPAEKFRRRSLSTTNAQDDEYVAFKFGSCGSGSTSYFETGSSVDNLSEHEFLNYSKNIIKDQWPQRLNISPLPRPSQNSSPAVYFDPNSAARNSKSMYPGTYGWKKVQQQIDYGGKVAGKLLGTKQGQPKRRNSKTKLISKLSLDFGSNEIDHAGSTPSSHDSMGEPRNQCSAGTTPTTCEKDTASSSILPTHGDNDLGHLLIDFLEFYGEAWENEKVGFSVRDGGFKFDLSNSDGAPSHPQADDPFVIEDPVNVMNNVAKTCYNVAGVMRCIQEAYGKYRACVVKPGSGGSVVSPRRRDLTEDVTDSPVTVDNNSDSVAAMDPPESAEPCTTSAKATTPPLQSTVRIDTDVHQSDAIEQPEFNQKIFSGHSVRMNIRTRATTYMQQHSKVPTNSPVNPTRRLGPVQSIVSEIFGLSIHDAT